MTDEPGASPLFSEGYISAQVLDIVSRYCDAGGGELDSHGIPAYAELMRLCAEGGDIEITGEFGDHLTGTITPQGRAYLNRLRADQLAGKDIEWSQCPEVESVPGRCSGAWVVKGTRLTVQAILDNAAGASAEEIATEIFTVPVEIVRRILAFAGVTALDYSDIPPLDDEFFSKAKHAPQAVTLYALFFGGQQISKAHTTRTAVVAEAYERGAVERRGEDFPGDPATDATLAPGYEIRAINIDR